MAFIIGGNVSPSISPQTQQSASQAFAGTESQMVASDFWGSPVYKDSNGNLFCPGFTGETYANNAMDMIILNGHVTPGLCRVMVDRKRDVDKKKGTGTDGARLTLHGVDPAKIDIAIILWTPQQKKVWDKMWADVNPKPGKGKPQPIDVQHPSFTSHGIRSIQIVGGRGWDDGPWPRSKQWMIEAFEFLPPGKAKATTTPVAASGSVADAPAYPTPGSNKANTGP